MPLAQEYRRLGWFALLTTWALAGGVILLQTALVREYVGLLDAQGLRGAAEAPTPLRQVIPARHADAQMWVRHALAGIEAGESRVRFTTVDNAPVGREVHWSSGFAWLLRGAAALQRTFGDSSAAGTALERAVLWFNAPLFFAVIVVASAAIARRVGVWAGVLLAAALVGHQRFQEPFAPTDVDHHGLVTAAILGLVLGAGCMGFGWWRTRPSAGPSLLPDSAVRARRAALVSAFGGAMAMWLNAATAVPAIALVACAGLAVTIWTGRRAEVAGARFDPGLWRRWGRTGALASAVFYVLEYAPSHLGWRLEVNHPLYALAWWGGGEAVAILAAAWLARARDGGGPRLDGRRLVAALVAIATAPAAILLGGAATFRLGDPFISGLRHFVAESRSLPEMVREFGVGSVGYDLTSMLILIPAALALRGRDEDRRLVLGALTFTALGFMAMAIGVVRWWVVASTAQIAVLIWLVSAAGVASRRRRILSFATAGALLLIPTLLAIGRDYRANQRRSAAAGDMFQPLYRDLAATLRANQPEGAIVVLANPNASAGISYFGRFQSIGTLFWENAPGLRTAAEMLCAERDEDARQFLRDRGVTHIVMISAAPFLAEYLSLLHPGRPQDEVKRTFGFRLTFNPASAPRWLQAIPYRPPAELAGIGGTISVFKTCADQTEDVRLFHTAVAQAARGETKAAEQSFLSAIALIPPQAHASFCELAGESAYEQGAPELALQMLRRSLQLRPEDEVANLAAWILATSVEPDVRDGVAALALVNPIAQRNPGDPTVMSTLAAAYAELGRFEEAVRAAEHALAAVRQQGGNAQAEALLARRLNAHRARQPWRQ